MPPAALPAAALVALASVANAAPPDKSGFHLFNPTPRGLMRDMETDRPDVTESPRTVDAGHFQVEASFFEYEHDDDNDGSERVETVSVLPSNLKVGLLNNVDLQLVLAPYVHERTHDQRRQTRDTADGFGDTQVRLKVNLWGNDGGGEPWDTAFGVMPYLKLPTASDDLDNDHVEGGLIFPLGIELPGGFGLGLMAEVDFVFDAGDHDYDIEFLHTANLNRDLFGDLAGYVEYVGIASSDPDSDYQAIFSTGLTYGLSPDVQLDAGVRLGLNEAAPDQVVFVGISFRY